MTANKNCHLETLQVHMMHETWFRTTTTNIRTSIEEYRKFAYIELVLT